MVSPEILTARIPDHLAGNRLDQALAEIFSDWSRNRLQSWIRNGRVRVDGQSRRPKDRVEGGEWIEMDAEPEAVISCQAEELALDIVFEDECLLVVNKPPGLVVHPAAGNWHGTLQNGLLHYDPGLACLPRAGLVHRIDKDTSGLLVVARTLTAHKQLVEQLQLRTLKREYMALVQGTVTAGGSVDLPIARHPVDRKKYAVREDGKPALTHYRIAERLTDYTLLRVRLETGRTHQIRVHMAHIRYPLVGDPVYGGRLRVPAGCSQEIRLRLQEFRRQALHATRLGLQHPLTGQYCEWQAAMPNDMQTLLEALRTL